MLAVGRPADAIGSFAGKAAGAAEDFGDGPGMRGLGLEGLHQDWSRDEKEWEQARTEATNLTMQTWLQGEPGRWGIRAVSVKENSKPYTGRRRRQNQWALAGPEPLRFFMRKMRGIMQAAPTDRRAMTSR
jgi:hypothetical protein